jgi:hypothetical protein
MAWPLAMNTISRKVLWATGLRVLGMSPPRRSVVVAVLGGMMAAAYLHSQGAVDLSFGFPRGGLVEGVVMAITGALAGFGVLLAFRLLRDLAERLKK